MGAKIGTEQFGCLFQERIFESLPPRKQQKLEQQFGCLLQEHILEVPNHLDSKKFIH